MSPILFASILILLVVVIVALCAIFLRRHRTPTPWNGREFQAGKWVGAIALLLAALNVGGCATPAADYVAADKANYQDIGGDYRHYVDADGALTPDERQGKLDSLELWRQRVEAAGPDPSP